MSSDALRRVAERMATDASFRRALVIDPDTALASYDLSESEKRSLLPSASTLWRRSDDGARRT